MSFPQRARYKYTCQALLSQGDIYIITTLQIMQQNTTEEASYAIKKKTTAYYTSRQHSCFQDCLFCSLNRELGHREQATLGDGQWCSVLIKSRRIQSRNRRRGYSPPWEEAQDHQQFLHSQNHLKNSKGWPAPWIMKRTLSEDIGIQQSSVTT